VKIPSSEVDFTSQLKSFRKAFDVVGTPLRIEFKSSQNPFKDD
jgi:predicted GTPase